MKASDLGVATATPEEEPRGDGGQHSEGQDGTGSDSATHQDTGVQATDTGTDAGDAEGGEGAKDPKDERINALVGKWQSEEHRRKEADATVEQYRKTFGELPKDGERPNITNQDHKGQQQEIDPNTPRALQPGWSPKTMEELQEGMKEVALYGAQMGSKSALDQIQTQQQAREDAERQVDEFVNEVKTADSEFDEKAFFAYANKYKFPLKSSEDLKSVYVNYIDFTRGVRQAQADGAKNRDGRKTPVHKPGSGGGEGNSTSYTTIRNARSAQELVQDALRK